MQRMTYAVAVLAAVGIMVVIAIAPASTTVMDQPGTLVLSVPKMECEFSCFPSVKKILQESDAVKAVDLAEQKEEGTIDNRQVIVKYNAGFDVDAAIALLDRKGFEKSDVVP